MQLKNGDNNPVTALRTFNPIYNGFEIFSYERGKSFDGDFATLEWKIDPLGRNTKLYDELFEMQLAYKNKLIVSADINQKLEGKILVVDIDYVINDGISEYETEGFIDYNDCPPIDTWFYLEADNNRRVLFAWIPQKFVPLVQHGWEVNMLEIFLWYEDWLLREKRPTIKFKKAGSKTSFLKHINNLLWK